MGGLVELRRRWRVALIGRRRARVTIEHMVGRQCRAGYVRLVRWRWTPIWQIPRFRRRGYDYGYAPFWANAISCVRGVVDGPSWLTPIELLVLPVHVVQIACERLLEMHVYRTVGTRRQPGRKGVAR